LAVAPDCVSVSTNKCCSCQHKWSLVRIHNTDVIKNDFGGKLPSGRPFRPDVRPRPRLSRGCGFTRGRVLTVRRHHKKRVRADATMRPRERRDASAWTPMSARTQSNVRADASPSPPLPSPSLPPSLPPLCCPRRREKKIKKLKKNILVVVAGLEREKKISIFNFRFLIPKIPKIPKLPKLPKLPELRGRSREKKKVFSA
jgi:hypothetical protein